MPLGRHGVLLVPSRDLQAMAEHCPWCVRMSLQCWFRKGPAQQAGHMRQPSAASSSSVKNSLASVFPPPLVAPLAPSPWLERLVSTRTDYMSEEVALIDPPSSPPQVTSSSSRTMLGSHKSSPHPGAGQRWPDRRAVWKHFGWIR